MRTVTLDLTGMKSLLRALNQMPESCRTQVLMPAGRNAGRTISAAVAARIHLGKGKRKSTPHYKLAMTSVVRDYQATKSVVVVVGATSRMAPHAHLVEDGTAQRFTNSKTRYRRTAVRARSVIHKGKLRTRSEYQKKSIGSFLKKKNKPQMNRGRMPAQHPVELGVKSITSTVSNNLKRDVADGITRMISNYATARGAP
jgi:hypothetical protein